MRVHTIHRTALLISLASATALLAACASMDASGPKAGATLEARSGSKVSGTIAFQSIGAEKVRIEARVAGLTPGAHGFHIHEVGDCSAPDASSAKGHFNPAAKPHGHHEAAERHAGDMPNLVADASGHALLITDLDGVTLADGARGILNRSVVIHADADDFKSQPAGNSGKRVACGVIRSH